LLSVPKDQVLGLLDEAWARKSPALNDKGLDVRIVDMGKAIGAHGERSVRMVTRPGAAEIVFCISSEIELRIMKKAIWIDKNRIVYCSSIDGWKN
jgi:predicted phosphoribosyltransferase